MDLSLIQKAFAEDFVHEDITSLGCIKPHAKAQANLVLKQDGVIAGLEFVRSIFLALDPNLTVHLFIKDGDHCPKGTILGSIEGSAHSILSGERTALNLLQHLSGIATLTAQCVAKTKGTHCKILDTRKTLPGYRELQKYGVRMGGGTNHRLHLADRILIKNNHLALVPLKECIEKARERFPQKPIEVEVGSFDECIEALGLGVEAILLDNMSPEEVRKCVEVGKGKVFLEASGGITLSNIGEYAETGVDGISIGALTHSAPALDISLRILRAS